MKCKENKVRGLSAKIYILEGRSQAVNVYFLILFKMLS